MKRSLYNLTMVLAFGVFFGFQVQQSKKFYYAFDEKIPLMEVDTKLVIRYSEEQNKESVPCVLRDQKSALRFLHGLAIRCPGRGKPPVTHRIKQHFKQNFLKTMTAVIAFKNAF